MHLLVQNMQFLVPAPESSQSKEASTIQGKRRASYREAQRGKKFTLSKQDCVLLKLVHCVICTFQFFFFIIHTNIIKMTMTRSASRPCSVCSQIFIKKKKKWYLRNFQFKQTRQTEGRKQRGKRLSISSSSKQEQTHETCPFLYKILVLSFFSNWGYHYTTEGFK